MSIHFGIVYTWVVGRCLKGISFKLQQLIISFLMITDREEPNTATFKSKKSLFSPRLDALLLLDADNCLPIAKQARKSKLVLFYGWTNNISQRTNGGRDGAAWCRIRNPTMEKKRRKLRHHPCSDGCYDGAKESAVDFWGVSYDVPHSGP